MTDYHKLWTSPSGSQSTFSAASGLPAVAMATDWQSLSTGKQKRREAGSEGLQAGCPPLPWPQLLMPRHPFGFGPPPWKPVPWRKYFHNALASECEFVGFSSGVKTPSFFSYIDQSSDLFSCLLPSLVIDCTSPSSGFLNCKMQSFLPHWVVARFK